MLIKLMQVNKHLVDCFLGDGWNNWSRWHIHSSGFLNKVAGMEIPSYQRTLIFNQIKKDMKK